MAWNYRIVKEEDSSLGLYEVYYDDNGKIEFWTADPILGPFEDINDLKTTLGHMIDDVNKCIEKDAILDAEKLENIELRRAVKEREDGETVGVSLDEL